MEFLFSNAWGDYCSLNEDFSNSRRYHGLFLFMDENNQRFCIFQGIQFEPDQQFICSNIGFDFAKFIGKDVELLLKFPYIKRNLLIEFRKNSSSNSISADIVFNSRNVNELSYLLPNINIKRTANLSKKKYNVLLESLNKKYVLSISTSSIFPVISKQQVKKQLFLSHEKARGYDYVDNSLSLFRIDIVDKSFIELVFYPFSGAKSLPNGIIENNIATYNQKMYYDVIKKSILHYLYSLNDDFFLLAGFHWFGSWGRDTFIVLPEFAKISLQNGWIKREVIHSLFDVYLRLMINGIIPNNISSKMSHKSKRQVLYKCAYNSSDASLWLINAAYEYVSWSNDTLFAKKIIKKIEQILLSYYNGNQVSAYDNGLLVSYPQTTWMDAVVDGVPVTPRNGKCIEINALWYNALKSYSYICHKINQKENFNLKNLHTNVYKAFQLFWNGKYYSDVIYTTNNMIVRDDSIRPNQLIACGVHFSPVPKKFCKSVIHVVNDNLLTPVGVKSLSKNDNRYVNSFDGNVMQKDLGYHNGAIWPWLYYYYIRSCKRAGIEPKVSASEILNKCNLACYNHLPEVYDQHYLIPDGCIAQLWSHVLISSLI